MARNSEKAMTALARWRRGKEEEEEGLKPTNKRPYLATECDNLTEAEKWRGQVIREVSKNVTAIQNAGLGEFRIRDLNDHINKLLREKRHWEDRIKELGGRTFSKAKMLDREGKEVPGNRGYKYFGAARDLPGVRELFETETGPSGRRTRAELMKEVDAQYYGFRDDDDGLIVPLELEAERDAIRQSVEEYKEKKGIEEDDDVDIYLADSQLTTDQALEEAMKAGKETRFTAHVAIPTQKDVEDALLRRKKQELLELLAIDATVEEIEQETGVEPAEDTVANKQDSSEKMDIGSGNGQTNQLQDQEMKPPGDEV